VLGRMINWAINAGLRVRKFEIVQSVSQFQAAAANVGKVAANLQGICPWQD